MFGATTTTVQIKDVCFVVSGKSIPTKLEDIQGNVPYIKVADFNLPGNEKYIASAQRYVAKESSEYSKMIPVGSVVFAKNGAASLSNKKRLTKIECCIDMNTMAIIPRSSEIMPEFLFAIIQAMDISAHVRQGAIPSISPKSIEDYSIVLPSTEEQNKYVTIVQQADKSGFGGCKSQFIEMFKGVFPMERWEDSLSITNGKKYDGEYQQSGTYPICGSGGIMGYGEQKLCPGKTVILGRKGNINTPIFMESEYWIVDTAFCLDVDKQKLHPKYFYYWCKQFDFTRYNKQGVLPSLTKNDLLKIEMPIPPMELQIRFVNIIEHADKSGHLLRSLLSSCDNFWPNHRTTFGQITEKFLAKLPNRS